MIAADMTKKYQMPKCHNKIIIDNTDLAIKGSHFLYLKAYKPAKVTTIIDNSSLYNSRKTIQP